MGNERLFANTRRAEHLDAIEFHRLMIILAGAGGEAIAAAAIVIVAQPQTAAAAAGTVKTGHRITWMHGTNRREAVAARAAPAEGVAAIDDACMNVVQAMSCISQMLPSRKKRTTQKLSKCNAWLGPMRRMRNETACVTHTPR